MPSTSPGAMKILKGVPPKQRPWVLRKKGMYAWGQAEAMTEYRQLLASGLLQTPCPVLTPGLSGDEIKQLSLPATGALSEMWQAAHPRQKAILLL